ncbi:MAG: IS4 family transposase [Bacteroidota bacterium]
MQDLSTLTQDKIKRYFPFHRICLVKILMLLVNCIIQSNSCNLNKVKKKGSIVLGKMVEPDSIYKRFIRFFKMKGIAGFTVGVLQMVLHLADAYVGDQTHYCLAIDRTNWKLGQININILMIGFVLGNGRFIPVYFSLLDKRGNSSQGERIALLDKMDWFFECFKGKPIVVVGDREFIGLEWFAYLFKRDFDFVLRLRKKDYLDLICEQYGWTKERLEKKIATSIRKKGYFVVPLKIDENIYYYHVRAKRDEEHDIGDKDKYIRFMSTSIDHQWVIEQYDRRWKIEVFFEDCKTKGFDLEAINFTNVEKIRLMVAICSLCYILCLIEGMIQFELKAPKKKLDHDSGKEYDRVSLFTKGLETIEQIAINVLKLTRYIKRKLKSKIPVNQYLILQHLYDS